MDILHQTIHKQKSNTNILKNNAYNLPNDTDALSDTKLDILKQTIQRQRQKSIFNLPNNKTNLPTKKETFKLTLYKHFNLKTQKLINKHQIRQRQRQRQRQRLGKKYSMSYD